MHTPFKKALLNHLKPGSCQAIEDYPVGEFTRGICLI